MQNQQPLENNTAAKEEQNELQDLLCLCLQDMIDGHFQIMWAMKNLKDYLERPLSND